MATPLAIASRVTLPKVSEWLGNTNMSALAKCAGAGAKVTGSVLQGKVSGLKVNGANKCQDLVGKPSMVFFGYTNCPDVCPTTLADTMVWKEQLGVTDDQVPG